MRRPLLQPLPGALCHSSLAMDSRLGFGTSKPQRHRKHSGSELKNSLPKREQPCCAATTTVRRDMTLMPFQKDEDQLGRGGGELCSSKADETPWPAVREGLCHRELDRAMLYYSREEPARLLTPHREQETA